MAQITKTATVGSAFGNEIEPIKFTFDYEELSAVADIPEDEKLDDKAVLTFVNARRNASARAKAQLEALKAAGYEAPSTSVASDPEARVKAMVKLLMLNGETEEAATQMARSVLKVA